MRTSSSAYRRFWPLLLVVCTACWQPPELPDPVAPSDAELLAGRAYHLRSPADVNDGGLPPAPSDAGFPLIMLLHGYGGTGSEILTSVGLDGPDTQLQAFIVTPRGTEVSPGVFAWNPNPTPAWPWDSAWLAAVLRDIMSKAPIDPSRVWVIGRSQGAHMANRLGCDHADLVTSVVSIAGQLTECAPSRPVNALQVHGTDDKTISYLSGQVSISIWAKADGCTSSHLTDQTYSLSLESDGGETDVRAWTCPGQTAVELWTMHGQPHHPDLSPEFPVELMKFLSAHAR